LQPSILLSISIHRQQPAFKIPVFGKRAPTLSTELLMTDWNSLTWSLKKAIVEQMRDEDGLLFDEIAERLGTKHGSVHDAYYRAKPRGPANDRADVAERNQKIIDLYVDHQLSTSLVAERMGVSRNIVCGVISRAGVGRDQKQAKQIELGSHTPKPKREPVAKRIKRPQPIDTWTPWQAGEESKREGSPNITDQIINRPRLTNEPEPLYGAGDDVLERVCTYIHGDPLKPGWRQCGHPGYPWCEYHQARMYNLQTKKAARSP
jgi:hypothetical protein